ncbi:helix-turn-helix domain-containing protein [Geomicrobium sediminis]|uniref:Transcriptional regulator with XRE-family HTH domain n=1 Tax=Geomicrobium sediminis TaxID=1347788 RepID=A0ABS2PEM0_9BACL|nr:helix-turn-helix transcriptional regulator [Geomicrobium sediminis]MBM7633874.1 transcriptional regulator with XRE-family HTH domain [Geomicrobium sediminis]
MTNTTIGQRLKKLRGKRTQNEVSIKLGLSRGRYAHYENDRVEPDIPTIKKLATFYNVSTDYLLGYEDMDDTYEVTVAGKEVNLSSEEYLVFEEIKKHPIMFNDLQTNTEKKVKELIRMWEYTKKVREDYEAELDPDDDGMDPLPERD